MGRAPCCEKMGLKKGPWTPDEDKILISHIEKNGHGNWRALPKLAGLLRCGKSCRLRWINYLRPDIKRGNFTEEEEENIIKLHEMLGNRWSAIAARLPGRTDNEIKNVWHTHLKKKKKLRNNPNNSLHAKHQPRKLSAKSEPSYDIAATEMLNDGPADTPTSPHASSEGTSVSDLWTATADVSYLDIKSEEMEPIQIPVIDDSFWSDDLDSFSVMGDNLLNDSSIHNLSAPIDEFEGMEIGYAYSELFMNCFEGSPGQSGKENADFWYDLLISSGGVYEEGGNGSTLLRDL